MPAIDAPRLDAPEAIDTRLVFRAYAWAGMVVGALILYALPWTRREPFGPLGPEAHLAMATTALWALTYYAGAFARVDDPERRLAALKEFAAAHGMVGIVIWTADTLSRGTSDLPPVGWVAFVAGGVLAYLGFTASPGARARLTVRSASGGHAFVAVEKERGAAARRLRARYEERIREAARQEERARLARDLHDAVKQQLFVIQTAAATAQARFESDPPGARLAIDHLRTAAREAIAEMGAMLDQLQAAPIESTGLVEAHRKQCEAIGFRTGATVDLRVEDLPPAVLLPPGAHEAALRVAQEALANVARHARARRVTVTLGTRHRALAMTIADDGAGFDPIGPRGMGIGNMEARAREVGGRFELTSSPGGGTTVSFDVPVTARSSRAYGRAAAAFAAALVVSAALLAVWSAGIPPWWVALATLCIAAVGLGRNLTALQRVRRLERSSP
jgi:signal transduction histidine kinase